jgi:hypothetical protein
MCYDSRQDQHDNLYGIPAGLGAAHPHSTHDAGQAKFFTTECSPDLVPARLLPSSRSCSGAVRDNARGFCQGGEHPVAAKRKR